MASQNWFVLYHEKPVGPISSQQLKQLAVRGKISPQSMVRLGVSGKWRQASSIKNLFAVELTKVVSTSASAPVDAASAPRALSPEDHQAADTAAAHVAAEAIDSDQQHARWSRRRALALAAAVVGAMIVTGYSAQRLIARAKAQPAAQPALAALTQNAAAPEDAAKTFDEEHVADDSAEPPPRKGNPFRGMKQALKRKFQSARANQPHDGPRNKSNEAKTSRPNKKPSPDELYDRALALDQGKGLPVDKRKAAALFERAAEAGHAEAMWNIGCMYANGEGVVADQRRATDWLKRSAEKGNAKGMFAYARQLNEGLGTAQDQDKAIHLVELAAQRGYQPAIDNLASIRAEQLSSIWFSGGEDEEDLAARERQRYADEADERRRNESFNADMERRRNQ